jgi:uncharacterized protein YqgC (DUF456 family)
MIKQPLNLFVFVGVLIGALVGTLFVPGVGTLLGAVVGGLVGLVTSHRRAKHAPTEKLPPRM